MGMVYHVYGFSDAAVACYQDAHTLAPRDFDWPYYLGRLYQDEGDNKKAIDHLRTAKDLHPDDIATLVNLAEVYHADGQLEPAKALFEKALALDPSLAAAEAGLGEIALSQGNYAVAIRDLEAAIKLQPEATSLHYPLAMAYRKSGDVANALIHLKEKGAVKPKEPDPLMDTLYELKRGQESLWRKGNQAMHEGRYPDAIKYYQQMLATSPEGDPLPRIYLGIALASEGNLQAAIEQYQQVLRVSPRNAAAQYNLGVLFLEEKSEREAVNHFDAAVALDPGFKMAHFQLANLLMAEGNYSEAVPHYTRAIDLGLDSEFTRLMKSLALVRLRRYVEARSELEKGVAAFPESASLATALARLLAACPEGSVRDPKRALQLSQQLLGANPSPDFDLVEAYGMALAAVGRFSDAANLQKRMIAEVESAKREDLAGELRRNLEIYEHGKACLVPWRDDDPIFVPQPGAIKLFEPQKGVPMESRNSNSR
jgi:tetratricopeptide (TPR) repeat protein